MFDNLEFLVNDEWLQFKKENPWLTFVPEFTEDEEGNKFMRRSGETKIYRITEEDEEGNQKYVCNDCGSTILGAKIAHPIWDGPFPMSGSGKCHYEDVPYCPKCEQKPDYHGAPIEIGEKIR
ncbi:MAG: hypothetical protein AABY22_36360 [Nanoarchaeota archaeon]